MELAFFSLSAYAWLYQTIESSRRRSEYMKKRMKNSVKRYHRHALIVYNHHNWAADIGRDKASFSGIFTSCLDKKKGYNVKVSACELFTRASFDTIPSYSDKNDEMRSVLLFPEGIICQVKKSDISEFTNLLKEPSSDVTAFDRFASISVPWKRTVCVCVHGLRDQRCGTRGPALLKKLDLLLGVRRKDVMLLGVSHIGGHEFAPALIAYPQANWHGCVEEDDVEELLKKVLDGEIYESCYRGNGLDF